MKKLAYSSLLIAVLIAVVQLVLHYSALPARVASHFGPGGQPDAFTSRENFALMMLAIVLGIPLLFVASARVIRVVPHHMINIPHRDYWLHEKRAARTLDELEASLVWLATITELFLIGVAQLTFSANLRGTGISQVGLGLLVLVILIAVGAFGFRLVRKYGRRNVLP